MLTGEQQQLMIGRITDIIQYDNDIHVTFQYSEHELQDFIFDTSHKLKVCGLFQVKTLNDMIGLYAYCILTKELVPVIRGLRLLEPDQNENKTLEIVLK